MVIYWSRFRNEVVFYGREQPTRIWDHIAEKMLLEFAESGCPIFRATTPLSRGQLRSKGHGKLSIHFDATQATVETMFRIIVSANQLSLYGVVAEMCEEHDSLHDRSGRPDRSDGTINEERIERPSKQDKLSKFCMDARFLSVVEIGQYFMTKDS